MPALARSLSLSVCWHSARRGNTVPMISFIPQAAPWWPQQVMLILIFLLSHCDSVSVSFNSFLQCVQSFIFFFPSVCHSSCYLNHCRQRCKCLHCRPSYKLLMSASNTSVYLTHHVGCEHLRTSKTLQFACSFLFCLNYRTLPSKPLSQWRHLWNQWNVQGRHIHWIRLQVPIRLQRNPLPTQ